MVLLRLWPRSREDSVVLQRLQMQNRNLDAVEQRACLKVAEECGADGLSVPAAELPAFIAWAVKSFADTMRKDLEEGGAPF